MLSGTGHSVRLWVRAAVLGAILVSVAACGGTPAKPVQQKVYKVGISQIVTHPSLDEAQEGFISEMTKLGYIQGQNITYEIRNAEGDMATNASIAQQLATGNPDLIAAITTPSTQAVAKAVEGTNIPVVFVAVTDPVEAGIVPSWDQPGGMISGVSDMNPVDQVIELATKVKAGAKRIGIIYNSGEVNSKVQVDMAKAAVAGSDIQIIEAPANASNEVLAAAQSLAGRADVIMIPTDNVAASALESILKIGQENGLPVISSDIDSVERGAAAGLGFNYRDLGEQMARMADKVLKTGVKPGTIPVEIPSTTVLAVNPKAAAAQGVTLAKELVDAADKVIE